MSGIIPLTASYSILKEENFISPLIEKLEKDFSLQGNTLPAAADLDSVRNHLTERIKMLIEKDFERFLNTLYRIDVSEVKVHAVLTSAGKNEIPEQLADLIIERQLQRLKTQQLYRDGKL